MFLGNIFVIWYIVIVDVVVIALYSFNLFTKNHEFIAKCAQLMTKIIIEENYCFWMCFICV